MPTITAPTHYTAVKAASLVLPPMLPGAPVDILRQSNALYLWHRPALVSFAPIMDATTSRTIRFTVPAPASLDGLPYRFEHRLLPQFNGTVSVKVEAFETHTGWVTIYGPTATASLTSGTWAQHAHTSTVTAGATMLRFTYDPGGGTNYLLVGHVLAYPYPTTIAPGKKPSGHLPYDDDLLQAYQAPVTTELVDRPALNAKAVMQDRKQSVFSLVQEDGGFGQPVYQAPLPGGTSYVPGLIGKATASIPGAKSVALSLSCLASVDAGATAGLVKVTLSSQASGDVQTLTFAADGSVHTQTAYLSGGTGDAFNVVRCEVRVASTTSNHTRLHALTAHWTPGV